MNPNHKTNVLIKNKPLRQIYKKIPKIKISWKELIKERQLINKSVKKRIVWDPKLIMTWILYCTTIYKLINKNIKKDPICLITTFVVEAFIVRPININRIVIPLEYTKMYNKAINSKPSQIKINANNTINNNKLKTRRIIDKPGKKRNKTEKTIIKL